MNDIYEHILKIYCTKKQVKQTNVLTLRIRIRGLHVNLNKKNIFHVFFWFFFKSFIYPERALAHASLHCLSSFTSRLLVL